MNVVWSLRAIRHLVVIGEYIEKDSDGNAALIAGQILNAIEILRTQPQMGRPGRLAGTRELVVSGTPYIVPYRVRRERLELLAVFDGRRQWPRRLCPRDIRSTLRFTSRDVKIRSSSMACLSGSIRSCRMRETRTPPGSRRKNTTCLPCSMRRRPGRTRSQGRPQRTGCRPASATRFKVVDITQGLVFAPRTQGVGADIHQVGIGKAG